MVAFSWRYDFVGAVRTWAITIMFCATGVICGLIVPFAITPSPTPGSLSTEGIVLLLEADDGMVRPVFQFSDQNGLLRELSSGLWSNKSAYHVGERITVIFNPTDPANAFVKNDKDLVTVFWITRILGFVFASIGLAVLGLKLKGVDDEAISRIGGLIGALTYSVPASFVLPGMWAAFQMRPNWMFGSDATFGFDEWMIGSIFTATGLIGLVTSIALYRYQTCTGEAGWYWSWSGSRSKE